MSALGSARNDFANSLLQICASLSGSQVAGATPRYGPGSVRAIHLVCRSPRGDHFDLVALRGFVVAPEVMRRQPGLWWLESENHPHLVLEDARVLDDAIGKRRLGCWPYCVPADRWNEAAAQHSWLPRSPVSDHDAADPRQRLLMDPRIGALALSWRRTDRMTRETKRLSTRSMAVRLYNGSTAVAYLFGRVARAPAALLAIASLVACAYYLAAVASWLWGLGDGLSGPEVQDGVVLILAGLVASWLTRLFAPKLVSSDGVRYRLPAVEGRERKPLVGLALDAYRAGVVLQLLAFAGFVVM
jgi:hypothetical protein